MKARYPYRVILTHHLDSLVGYTLSSSSSSSQVVAASPHKHLARGLFTSEEHFFDLAIFLLNCITTTQTNLIGERGRSCVRDHSSIVLLCCSRHNERERKKKFLISIIFLLLSTCTIWILVVVVQHLPKIAFLSWWWFFFAFGSSHIILQFPLLFGYMINIILKRALLQKSTLKSCGAYNKPLTRTGKKGKIFGFSHSCRPDYAFQPFIHPLN